MTQKKRALAILKENHGVLTIKEAKKDGIDRWAIKSLVEDGKVFRIQPGVYADSNAYVDDFYLIQEKYPNGVFSHETALYLHGYSDRIPIKIQMTFKRGENVSRMRKDNIQAITISGDENYGKGCEKIGRPGGMSVRVYCIERVLVDLLKPRYDTDLEQLFPAIKKYMTGNNRNINKLLRYAKDFNVEDKMRIYIGVLL